MSHVSDSNVPIVIPAFVCCECKADVPANRGHIQKEDKKYCEECGLTMMANMLNGISATQPIDNG